MYPTAAQPILESIDVHASSLADKASGFDEKSANSRSIPVNRRELGGKEEPLEAVTGTSVAIGPEAWPDGPVTRGCRFQNLTA
ncbi:MAG TPA: hypothetical protein VLZ81_12230 [Blastocatellia bacterium]|nr:hypothetical protein [Blastocatellia bacterium]